MVVKLLLNLRSVVLGGVLLCLGTVISAQEALPGDVKPEHWAASAVRRAVSSGVLPVKSGGKFGGEAQATQAETVKALAKLAQTLIAGSWPKAAALPVPQSTMTTLGGANWEAEPVSRYALAVTLASAADYIAVGLVKPDPKAADAAKSVKLPPAAKVALPTSHPSRAALIYLARNRMIRAKSPLLRASASPVTGAELSRALADVMAGVINRVTPMGKDADGSTPDVNSRPRARASSR